MDFIYRDSFLATLVTQTNENDAVASIATYGSFTEMQLEQLVPLRTYVLCCIDNVKAPDDIFATKKKMYEKEFVDALSIAKTKDATGATVSIFSIPISRS